MAKGKIAIDGSQFDALMKQIGSLPTEVSRYVRANAMPKAMAVTEHVAKATVPRGNDRDRNKQSAKHKKKWAGTPRLSDAIVGVVRDYSPDSFTGFVGVEFPWGNKSYFDYHGTKDRTMVFWGRRAGRVKKKYRWMRKVMDIAEPQIQKIFEVAITDGVSKHMGGKT